MKVTPSPTRYAEKVFVLFFIFIFPLPAHFAREGEGIVIVIIFSPLSVQLFRVRVPRGRESKEHRRECCEEHLSILR